MTRILLLALLLSGCCGKAYIAHGRDMYQKGMDTQKLINLNLELQNSVLRYVVEQYEEAENRRDRSTRYK